MEKKKTFENKIFPMKFSKLIIGLSIAALVLCGVGIATAVYNIIQFGVHNVYDGLKYPFLIIICLVCIVFVVAILKSSSYEITKEKLIAKYGFLKSEYPILQFTALMLDRDENKLVAYMGEEFMMITVDKKDNEAFARTMLEVNGDIDFSYTITENKPPENDGEK